MDKPLKQLSEIDIGIIKSQHVKEAGIDRPDIRDYVFAVARKAEEEIAGQVISNLHILIGNVRLKDGFKEGVRLAEQLHDLLTELKKLALPSQQEEGE